MTFEEWFKMSYPLPVPGIFDSVDLLNMKVCAKSAWYMQQEVINAITNALKAMEPSFKELIQQNEELKRRAHWLQCLESAGVDNWEGISYARELMDEE